MKNKIIYFFILIILFSCICQISSADWYKGTLHVHTGYSTKVGYDGDLLTFNDNCKQEGLPWADYLGYNVTDLKEQAESLGLDFQSYTDHSYCLDSSEFNTVKTDCLNAQDSSFTCLSGEELSTVDSSAGEYDESLCFLYEFPFPPYRAAHLGANGISNFISQNPTDKWCPDSPTAQGGIDSIINNNGFSIINHPYSTFFDFESIDYVYNYTGIEILNAEWDSGSGLFDSDDESAILKWKEFLLGGKKILAYGGIDTHTNASDTNVNYVYLNSLTDSNLKTALKQGYSSVSNNGELYIEIANQYGNSSHLGETINVCEDDYANITITYNTVLSQYCNLRLYKGEIGDTSESYWDFGNVQGPGSEELDTIITSNSYFRAECINSTTNRRIYSNPIWVELSPDSDGDGYCNLNDCNDNHGGAYPGATEYCDGVDNNCDGVIDEGCEGSEPPNPPSNCSLVECNETGYDQCAEFSCDNGCDVKIAVNHYTNVNNIKWSAVNDSSDPYIVNNYTFGWKKVYGNQMYYNVIDPGTDGTKDCMFGGCHTGERLFGTTGTKTTVTPPGIASRKIILGYKEIDNFACWVWYNEFSPDYGSDNLVYILNCFDDSDCSSGYFCDKTGNWPDWSCILKKSDGQNCTSNSQCQSGYCDNDGVGLSDDDWCFTPYNTSFDNQETNYCEYSTGNGDVQCDEKTIGNGCGSDCKYSINAPNESLIIFPNGYEQLNKSIFSKINWSLSDDLNKDFIRYSLQYSNNSGVNWTDIISNYGYENKLNDSSTSKLLNFSGNENKTIYLRLPKKAKVSHARLDLGGLSL